MEKIDRAGLHESKKGRHRTCLHLNEKGGHQFRLHESRIGRHRTQFGFIKNAKYVDIDLICFRFKMVHLVTF